MLQNRKIYWLIPVVLLIAMAIVVWLSPEERTLGTRIKIVYIHVSFVWTGLTGILLTGLLSVWYLLRPSTKWLGKFLPVMSITSLIIFGIGFVLSLAAAKINWGAIPWTEPRAIGAMRILAMGLIIQVLAFWFPQYRLRAVLNIGLLIFAGLTSATMRNAVHPTNPIFTSESNSFAIAVLTLTGLVMLLAWWVMQMGYWRVRD